MANYYPPVGFHFKVEVVGLTGVADDVRFTEVGRLTAELATEEVAEGGENRFTQRYPTRAKYPEVSLKRGLLKGSQVAQWARECIEDLKITPRDVFVKLLNEEHEPLLTWQLTGSFPTRWSVSDLNSTASAIVVESLQLSYQFFRVIEG